MSITMRELTLPQITKIINACASYDYDSLKDVETEFGVEQVSTIYSIWENEVFVKRILEEVHSKMLLDSHLGGLG